MYVFAMGCSMNIEDRNKIQDRFQYILNMRPVLNKQALFSDTTQDYVTPAEPRFKEKVTVRFRTAKNNVDAVFLISGSKSVEMVKTEVDALFDYYSCVITMDEKIFGYCFQIIAGKVMCYFNSRGISRDVQEYYNFRLIAGFRTPTWAKGAVMYQIFVDRFYNGDKSNDVLTNEYTYLDGYSEQVTDWGKYPAQMGVREFYGGDLQGVLDKMDYLEDLGIDVIYFNPLFVSPSNHKYDIQDYDYIDPHIGKIVEDKGELLKDGQKENRFATRYINRVTNKKNLEASNELFAKVVKEAHKRGIKVILDGVFNHCGSFNKWLDRERIYEEQECYEKGAFISEDSPYKDYFRFHKDDCWPYNPSYDGWWGHDTLPKLNYEGSRELTDYIMKIGRKWVSAPYNADGWRLDVAADLGHSPEFNHRFWKEFRKSVKLANPNAVIIAEHYGYSREWLQGDEWDSVMNYDAFMEPVTWFLTGMQKHSDDYREDLLGNAESFWGAMTHHGTNFTNSSLQVSMNELSNHDHSRFLTRTNKKVGRLHTLGSKAAEEGINKAVFREAVVMQMTWPGAPTIYYGDEAGVCGFTDPDNRRTYPWGHEDRELIEFHKQMIRVHKLNGVLLTGSLMNLGEDYNYVAYGRFDKEEQIVVMVNNNDHEIEKEVSTWRIGVPKNAQMQRIAFTDQNGFSFNTVTIRAEDGKIKVKLPAESACVFKAIISENGLKRTPVSDENMVDKQYPEKAGEADALKSKSKKADSADLIKEEKPDKKAEKADAKEVAAKADSKSDSKTDGAKSEAKSDSKAEDSKSGNKAEGTKSDNAKSETKADGKNDGTKSEGKSDNVKSEGAKSEAKSDNKSDEAKTENKADSAKSEAKADSDKKDKASSKDAVKTEADKKDKADNKSASDNKDKAAKADAGKEKSKEAVKAEPEETKPKKSAWEVAEEVLGKPEDNKKSWFPFFK